MSVIDSKPCPRCRDVKPIHCTFAELLAYEGGVKIQHAFPNMTTADRERLITGYCPACWDAMFADEEEEDECPESHTTAP